MEFDALYHERIDFRMMYFMALIFTVISLVMLGLLIYHLGVAPIDNDPELVWVFSSEFLVMGAVAILMLQFRTLDLYLTYQGIVLKFSRIKKSISWTDIVSYQVIATGSFINSGGWKVGLGRNGWYAMYTVVGKPRISLKLHSGRIKEILFSTANPEEVVRIIKKQTGKDESQSTQV